MTFLRKLLLSSAVLAMGACTNAAGLGGANTVDLTGAGATAVGSPSDPNSVAYFQQTIGDRVLFLVDQSTLTAQGKATLDGQATWLLANTDYSAIIEGHADEQGTREYNLGLGAKRANSAREYLVSRGVAGNRVKTVSYGKERPIEICSEESCYEKNRRAVTVLSGALAG